MFNHMPVFPRRSPMATKSSSISDQTSVTTTTDESSSDDGSVTTAFFVESSHNARRHRIIPSTDALDTTENTPFSPEDDVFFGASPVIGILSQPRICSETEETEYVIAASYAKWVESAGARTLPIPWDATEEMTRAIFPHINGVLFPGGNSILPVAAITLWDLANEANANGDFFPIWGTCLGYEYFLMLASGKGEFVMENGYDSHNVSCPVKMTNEKSDLYATAIMKDIVSNQFVTMNNHELGLQPETFQDHPGLVDAFRITSVNEDRNGKSFISTIESTKPEKYPYYGVQFHPEKNPYEYATEPGTNTPFEMINHSADAVYFSFQLASFFVSLARKNLCKRKHVYRAFEDFPLLLDYELRRGVKFQQYYLIPAVGETTEDTAAPFTGQDFSWRLDLHLGLHKEGHTDE